LSGSGNLVTATNLLIIYATANFNAQGSLTSSAQSSGEAFVGVSGEGNLTAGGAIPGVANSAAFSSFGSLTAQGKPSPSGLASLSSESTLVVVYPFTRITASGSMALSGEGSLIASSVFRASGTIDLSVDGALDVSGSAQRFGAIDLSMIGDLQVRAEAQALQTLNLLGVGTLSPSGATPYIAYPASFSMVGVLKLRGVTNIIYVQTGPITEIPPPTLRERPSIPWREHYHDGPITERPTPADVSEPSLLNKPIVERNI
jgi:hypothetical protein